MLGTKMPPKLKIRVQKKKKIKQKSYTTKSITAVVIKVKF